MNASISSPPSQSFHPASIDVHNEHLVLVVSALPEGRPLYVFEILSGTNRQINREMTNAEQSELLKITVGKLTAKVGRGTLEVSEVSTLLSAALANRSLEAIKPFVTALLWTPKYMEVALETIHEAFQQNGRLREFYRENTRTGGI